jgi:hypothetical protein
MKSWEPQTRGIIRGCPGLYRVCFTLFTFVVIVLVFAIVFAADAAFVLWMLLFWLLLLITPTAVFIVIYF